MQQSQNPLSKEAEVTPGKACLNHDTLGDLAANLTITTKMFIEQSCTAV